MNYATNFDVLLTVYLSIIISVINQFDAQNFCFTMSLFHTSTCFKHMCSSSGGQNCITQPLVSSHLWPSRSFCRHMPATVAFSRSNFSFITFLLTRHLALHELGSRKVCSSTYCAAEWQLPLTLCLAVSVYRVYWTDWNNGRGLPNAASHTGNYVRMFLPYTHVVFTWISYDS